MKSARDMSWEGTLLIVLCLEEMRTLSENVSANDILAGIDRFRSKSKLTEMRDDEAKLFSAQKGRDANG